MPKPEEKPPDQPEEWTPDKPMPDADDETDVQRKHMAQRRLKYLEEQSEKNSKNKKKGDKTERRSLFAV